LQLLLILGSAVILGFESRGTRDHVLVSQIWDFPFVASYYWKGYGGGIRREITEICNRNCDKALTLWNEGKNGK
jgi:hypothetical protein